MPTIPLSSGFSIISRDFFTNYIINPKTYMLSKGNELVFPPILNKLTIQILSKFKPLENGDYKGPYKQGQDHPS